MRIPFESSNFFPDSFKSPANFESLNSGNTLQRTEIVNHLSYQKGNPEIVVTYPEALFEQVVSPNLLEKNRIQISKGVDFESALHSHVNEKNAALIDKINSTGDFTDEIEAELKAAVEEFKRSGAY